ncbi:MAG: hypothetical protein Q4B12_06120 [Bowdeniella nasicola]|nr:hypothetical protein [Bowdeniella nasicola]
MSTPPTASLTMDFLRYWWTSRQVSTVLLITAAILALSAFFCAAPLAQR